MNDSPPPVLIRLLRGDRVESVHRGAFVVLDGAQTVLARGDFRAPIYCRSAAKPFQTTSALLCGIAEEFDLEPADLAVISASHNGETRHVERARSLLEKGGFRPDDLQCGTHPPAGAAALKTLHEKGIEPCVLHNNCSGKHAGMLLTCRLLGADPATYLDPEHPIQEKIRETMRIVCECPPPGPEFAIDGCSAPTFRLPLDRLATGFRNIANPDRANPDRANPEGASPEYAAAASRVRDAMMHHSGMVAGLDRIDTDLMTAGGGRFLSKIGAEGIMACGIPGQDLGIAIAIEDGAPRAYEHLMMALLDRLDLFTDADRKALHRYRDPILRNHAGKAIGRVEVQLDEEDA